MDALWRILNELKVICSWRTGHKNYYFEYQKFIYKFPPLNNHFLILKIFNETENETESLITSLKFQVDTVASDVFNLLM